jgi:tellurite resistance protein TehA-like permease
MKQDLPVFEVTVLLLIVVLYSRQGVCCQAQNLWLCDLGTILPSLFIYVFSFLTHSKFSTDRCVYSFVTLMY